MPARIAAGPRQTLSVVSVEYHPVYPSPRALFADRSRDNSSTQSGPSLKSVEQPPSTLVDAFPGFSRFESELSLLGQHGLTTRAATLGRMTADELVAMYEAATARTEFLHGAAVEISSQLQVAAHDQSEAMLFLTLHRLYDIRRGTRNADAQMPDNGQPPLPTPSAGSD